MGDVKSSIETAVAYLGEHPDEARYTDSSATAVLEEGLRVLVTDPDGHHVVTDMPASVGGGGQGPSPGWLLRAALASCGATLIAMRAAESGVDLDRLEVTVDSESDDRGILGMSPEIPAGPLSVRVRISIQGPGDAMDDVVREAITRCPVHDAMARAVPVSVETVAG